MSQLSIWARTILLLSVSFWAGRCAESPGLTGTTDADVSGMVDADDALGPDSSLDLDGSGSSDTELDGAVEDAVDAADVLDADNAVDAVEIPDSADAVQATDAVDTTDNSDLTDAVVSADIANDGSGDALDADDSGDADDAVDADDAGDADDSVDTGDASPDAAGELGTPCGTDVECASGECFDLAGGDITGLCSVVCVEADDCAEGFDCALVTFGGADAEGRCLPVDYCADSDGDGFGVGPGCRGVDCNDDDFTLNIDAIELCDGVDNDCDGVVDDSLADVGDDCSTGLAGICAPGRTQCVEGEVRCIAFASPIEEFCDGRDNDCDGSVDEGVLPEGYRVVDGVCEPVTCGAVPAASANARLVSVSSTQFGGLAEYACDDGYVLTAGALSRSCDATGAWTGNAAVCTPVDCGGLPNPANGSVALSEGTVRGAIASYSCDIGYVLSGSATRVCNDTGLWSGAPPSCAPVDCGEPPVIDNGERTFAETTLASTANYVCNAGYQVVGTAMVDCDVSGAWSTPPTCEDVDECVPAGAVCTGANNVCMNVVGSWECACAAGYTGTTLTGRNASCLARLATECTSDSECPSNSWCSTVSGYRRCSPRVFGGAEHQMDFVFVPSGTFQQGTTGSTSGERPYTATISRNYFVSRTEVTQGQWKAATGGTNGACFQSVTGTSCTTSNANNNGPVEQVDWYSTLAYANWLSLNQGLSACYVLTPSTCADAVSDWATGETACTGATFTGLTCTGYRLLTESEWERAARGNTTSNYYWGETTDAATAGIYAWFSGNAGSRTQAVGGKRTNVFGLRDINGNVFEWLWDFTSAYPIGSATDYIGPPSGSSRGVRGGSWESAASGLRVALRNSGIPSDRLFIIGFRLARTAP